MYTLHLYAAYTACIHWVYSRFQVSVSASSIRCVYAQVASSKASIYSLLNTQHAGLIIADAQRGRCEEIRVSTQSILWSWFRLKTTNGKGMALCTNIKAATTMCAARGVLIKIKYSSRDKAEMQQWVADIPLSDNSNCVHYFIHRRLSCLSFLSCSGDKQHRCKSLWYPYDDKP